MPVPCLRLDLGQFMIQREAGGNLVERGRADGVACLDIFDSLMRRFRFLTVSFPPAFLQAEQRMASEPGWFPYLDLSIAASHNISERILPPAADGRTRKI